MKRVLAWVLMVTVLITALPVPVLAAPDNSLTQFGTNAVAAPNVPVPTPDLPDWEAPTQDSEGDVHIMWLETAMDIAGLAMSLAEYNADPTFWNALGVVIDGAAVVIPGLPAVGAIRGGAKAAMGYLRRSVKLRQAVEAGGVAKYWKLLLRFMPSGWQRHHIIEARFAERLGTTSLKMPAIPIESGFHTQITGKMRAKIPYGSDYSKMAVRDILGKHVEAYGELFEESQDVYWEYLRDYVQEILSKVPSNVQ